MRFDRDQIDRNSVMDRQGGIAALITLTAYLDTDSDIYALIELGPFGAYLDTNSDVFGRLQLTHLIVATLDTDSDVYALLRLIASFTFAYAGTIEPGETLCIDSDKFTVMLDGADAFVDFSGEYPMIHPGANWVIYSDSEGARTVTLIVSKKDRSV